MPDGFSSKVGEWAVTFSFAAEFETVTMREQRDLNGDLVYFFSDTSSHIGKEEEEEEEKTPTLSLGLK